MNAVVFDHDLGRDIQQLEAFTGVDGYVAAWVDLSTECLILAPNSGLVVAVIDGATCAISTTEKLARDQPTRYDPGGLTYSKFIQLDDGFGPLLVYERGVMRFTSSGELLWHAVHGQFEARFVSAEDDQLTFDGEAGPFSIDAADGHLQTDST